MVKLIKTLFILLFILLASIASLETLLKFYYKSQPFSDNVTNNIFALIEHDIGNGILLPISKEKIIKFKPNNNVRWDNYYYNKGKFIKEWSYTFHTNNYGLVQKEDISNKKSILFLGDSFTQGVGAEPWIDKFEGRILDLQVINGGIFGTGFQQFKLMEEHLSSSIDIQKIVVLYLGGDIRRGLFYSGNNFGFEFPLSNQDPYDYLKEIQKKNVDIYKKKKLVYKLKDFVRSQHLWSFARYIVQSVRLKNDETIKNNFQAIKDLHTKYGENIYFIKMKMPQEIVYQKDSYETKISLEFIKQLTDNTFQCNFENNINSFHQFDGHPNKDGYENLFKCVKKILLDI